MLTSNDEETSLHKTYFRSSFALLTSLFVMHLQINVTKTASCHLVEISIHCKAVKLNHWPTGIPATITQQKKIAIGHVPANTAHRQLTTSNGNINHDWGIPIMWLIIFSLIRIRIPLLIPKGKLFLLQ